MYWYTIILPIVFATDELTCYYDYQLYGDWCYHSYEKPLSNYDEAVYLCKQDDAELVSIHDAFSNTYLRNLADGALIGLRYYQDQDRYLWSDDSVLDYKNYADGFEQYRDFYGYCAKLASGKWTNAECEADKLKFVCYKKAYHFGITLHDVCPNSTDVHMSSGVIVSPGYPLDFHILSDCFYSLVGRNNYYIVIRFESVELQNGNIKIYKTWDPIQTNLVATVNNYFTGLDVTVNHNHALLQLTGGSEGKWEVSWISKNINVSEILKTECLDERALFTNFEDIVSPGYPESFTFSIDVASLGCNYKVITTENNFLRLHLDTIQFTSNVGYVEIYYGWDDKKVLIGRYNNNNQGNDLIIRGNRALIKVYGATMGKYRITWAQSPVACKSGWSYYSYTDSCYYFNYNSMSEPSAQDYCVSQSANLTSILSSEENQFLRNMIAGHGIFWFGLKEYNWWYWIDGSALSYSNWYSNQPQEEDYPNCAILGWHKNEYWDDYGCSHSEKSICKYKRAL